MRKIANYFASASKGETMQQFFGVVVVLVQLSYNKQVAGFGSGDHHALVLETCCCPLQQRKPSWLSVGLRKCTSAIFGELRSWTERKNLDLDEEYR